MASFNHYVIFVSLICSIEALNDPPLNPYLADSSWPVCHGNSYATDTSFMIGPTSNDEISFEFLNHHTFFSRTNTYLPVSIVFDDNEKMWATSVTTSFSFYKNTENHQLKLSTYDNGAFDFSYHGAYSFVSYDGVYFSSSQKGFRAYSQYPILNSKNEFTQIIKRGEFELNLEEHEKVIGVLPIFDNIKSKQNQHLENQNSNQNNNECDNLSIRQQPTNGYIVVVTSRGKVAIVARVSSLVGEDFYLACDIYQININDLDFKNQFEAYKHIGSEISNSFAVDENGGIYIVSAKSLHYLKWNMKLKTLSLIWSQQYSKIHQRLYPGRLGKGSGSSPSILQPLSLPGMQNVQNIGKLIIITDGNSPMNILAFRVKDGTCVGNASVLFGQSLTSSSSSLSSSSLSSNLKPESTSEQSITVLNNRAIVVQNWIDQETIPYFCQYFGNYLPGKAKNGCVYLFGVKPRSGVEQFYINPRNGQIHSEWVNKYIQCSSSIPAASTDKENGLFYCIGMRSINESEMNHHIWYKLFSFLLPSNIYTLEALNMKDGSLNFTLFLGTGCFYNPNYAGIQIGSNKDIYVGTIGGVLKIAPMNSSSLIETNIKETDYIKWLYPTSYIWFLHFHLTLPMATLVIFCILILKIIIMKYLFFNYLPKFFQIQYNQAAITDLRSKPSQQFEEEEDFEPPLQRKSDPPKTLPEMRSMIDNDDNDDEDSQRSSHGEGQRLQALKERLREEQQARILERVARRQSEPSNKRTVPGTKSPAKRSRLSHG